MNEDVIHFLTELARLLGAGGVDVSKEIDRVMSRAAAVQTEDDCNRLGAALVDHIEDIKVERARRWSIGTPFVRVCEAEALFLVRLVLSAADGCAMLVPAPRMKEMTTAPIVLVPGSARGRGTRSPPRCVPTATTSPR